MKSNDRPEAYGVFKPVGHVIVALPSAADAAGARGAMLADGFTADDIVAYSPDEMTHQADIDIEQAGVLAGIGQELNLVKAHRALALKGFSFLVVKAPDDDGAQKVADIARRFHAKRAQKYGRLMIEELIDDSRDNQTNESPDLGLDVQAR
jgi:hypothetical protein